MSGAVSRHEALRRLASTPPRDLPRAGAASGERPLQSLAAALRSSGAACDSRGAVGAGFGGGENDADVAALGTIFDAAVDAGLGCLVLDYVAEVCEDPLLTSSDPVEAYLADGACVSAWCRASLASTRALVEAAAKAPLLQGGGRGGGNDESRAAAEGLATARTRLAALVPLAEALSRGGSGRGVDASDVGAPPSLLEEASRLSQCADVLDWAWSEGQAADASPRFPSEAEWRAAVAGRREAVAGGLGRGPSSPLAVSVETTFLDALLARVSPPPSVDYPPAPTPRASAPAIFLRGGGSGETADARRARLDLFAYLLADAGGSASLPSLGARFGASGARVATWRLSQLLDEAMASAASAGETAMLEGDDVENAALEAAARAVPAAASPETPYELGKALVALERPEAALALLRARKATTKRDDDGGDDDDAAFERRLDEALTALSARLECGVLSEAFTEARVAAARAAPAGTERHATATRALTTALARWAAESGELPSVAMFPLSSLEERCLIEWLDAKGERDGGRGDAALQKVLFYLQRGRAPEALLAASAAGGKLVNGSSGDATAATAERGALELLRQAARSLPAAQRALLLTDDSSPSLRFAAPGEPAPEGATRLVLDGWADAPAASLVVGGGGEEKQVPLLRSLASEGWMEESGKRGAGEGDGAQRQKQPQQQQPQPLRPRTRASAASAATVTPAWTAAATATPAWTAATPSAGGFLAPVGGAPATTTKKKARLAAVRF